MEVRHRLTFLVIATLVVASSAHSVSVKTVNSWNGKSDNDRVVQGVASPAPHKTHKRAKAKLSQSSKTSPRIEQPPPLHDPN